MHSKNECQPQVFSEFRRVCLWFLEAIHRLISFLSFHFYRFQSRLISYVSLVFGYVIIWEFYWVEIFSLDGFVSIPFLNRHSTDNGKKRQLLFQPVDESVVWFSFLSHFAFSWLQRQAGERNEKSFSETKARTKKWKWIVWMRN